MTFKLCSLRVRLMREGMASYRGVVKIYDTSLCSRGPVHSPSGSRCSSAALHAHARA